MDIEEVFFIDRNGNKISSDNISSHIGLAQEILKQNQVVNNQFLKSGIKDPVEFLVSRGYIKISEIRWYKVCQYSSSQITEVQREYVNYYEEHGFDLEDYDFLRLKDEGR